MATGLKQELRQGQSLVMTQQLQQAIKLLQLSNLELSHFVEQEVEKNPFLELEDPSAPPADGNEADASPSVGENLGEVMSVDRRLAVTRDLTPSEGEQTGDSDRAGFEGEPTVSESTERRDEATNSARSSSTGQGGRSDFSTDQFESRVSNPISLREHLLEQLGVTIDDAAHRLIAQYLIDTLDDAGYLTEPIDQVAERLGSTTDEIEETLEILTAFDPPGVFARDLGDCLAIQLRERDRFDPAMAAFTANLHLLADGKFDELRRICGIDDEDLSDMVAEIRTLDPKPGLAFQDAPVEVVVPDVFIRRRTDGTWAIELNSDTLPKVLIDRIYYAEISGTARKGDDKAYLSECLSTANWLVKALDQRARTILKVATELVRQQENFFLYGVSHLRPLNLRQIADEIDMHESTVSRVTSNKYLSCTRGTFELKYFFSSSISGTDGGAAHSSESVRHKIRALIDSEEPKAILSDDKIVTLLKAADIDIARRTVAKYRESMSIPSSVQRRRLKSRGA